MDPKRYIITFVSMTLLIATALALGGYWLDPFRIYHTPLIQSEKYLSQDRYQNAGLIADNLGRRYCCDSILVGTSLSQNWDPDTITKAMGGKQTLNLTMAGSSAQEQGIIVDAALATGQVNTVYWELHDRYFERTLEPLNAPKALKEKPGSYFPVYLYDQTILNDIPYIFSVDPYTQAFSRLRNGRSLPESKAWYLNHKDDFGKGAALAASNPDIGNKSPNYTHFDALTPIDDIVAPAIKNHPDVTFHLFIPPYPLHYYAAMADDTYADMMGMRAYLARTLKGQPNVRIHYFDRNSKNIENLDLYKDLTHYHPDFYVEMLSQMRDSSATVETSDMDRYIRLMTRRVNDYIKTVESK